MSRNDEKKSILMTQDGDEKKVDNGEYSLTERASIVIVSILFGTISDNIE